MYGCPSSKLQFFIASQLSKKINIQTECTSTHALTHTNKE